MFWVAYLLITPKCYQQSVSKPYCKRTCLSANQAYHHWKNLFPIRVKFKSSGSGTRLPVFENYLCYLLSDHSYGFRSHFHESAFWTMLSYTVVPCPCQLSIGSGLIVEGHGRICWDDRSSVFHMASHLPASYLWLLHMMLPKNSKLGSDKVSWGLSSEFTQS